MPIESITNPTGAVIGAPERDPSEVSKFEQLAGKWWDTESEFKPLHDINPLRMSYITDRVELAGKRNEQGRGSNVQSLNRYCPVKPRFGNGAIGLVKEPLKWNACFCGSLF